jgi:hypothetical protein
MRSRVAAKGRKASDVSTVQKLQVGRSAMSGYGHRIKYHSFMGGYYRLSWSFDTKVRGSRLRYPRTITRDTDREGAERFAKKWDIPMPKTGGKP